MKQNTKESTIDGIVAKIKKMIFSEQYHVGDKLPTEKTLCAELEVGRSTLREALKMLTAMGYVETLHGKGTFVKCEKEENISSVEEWFAIQESQLNDYFEVRCAIEVLNIKYAIFRRNEKDIEQLETIHNRFENASMRGDAVKMAIWDENFHMAIAEMTRNNLLIVFNKRIAADLRPYRSKTFLIPGNVTNALVPHQEIIKAIKERNLELGIEAVKKHIDISLRDISYCVQDYNENKERQEPAAGE